MNKKLGDLRRCPGLVLVGTSLCLGLGTFTVAQTPSTTPAPAEARQSGSPDADRQELANFHEFMENHREIAEQLRKDPSLVNNAQFMKSHPALQTYLQQHPGVSDKLKNSPDTFMYQEAHFKGAGGSPDADRRELESFHKFMDDHHEIADQLRKDPSLVNSAQYLKAHPELQTYLQQHPEVSEKLKNSPDTFMYQEDHMGQNNDDHRGVDRRELASFNQFLDSHREIAEQLRKNPPLVDNEQFLKNHPALETYLQNHPGVSEQFKNSPDTFMEEEARYENHDQNPNGGRGYEDGGRTHSASFGEFLGNHRDVAEQLSKDPTLCKNQEYMQSHPELQSYLTEHPEVKQDLMSDPQNFVKSAQQFNTGSEATKAPATTAPTTEPKPKQQ
jgi:hypothetical protein